MSAAKVTVIRAFKIGGVWHMPGAEPMIETAEAREWEAKGYCEILEVDGQRTVWGACCGGDHGHG